MDLEYENIRLRALIAEIERRVVFESFGTGNTFSEAIECLVHCGGQVPTIEQAYSGELRCARHGG